VLVGVFVFILYYQIKLVNIPLLHIGVLQAYWFYVVQGSSKLTFLGGKTNVDFA
jgi:hypothetical protein